MRAFGLCCTQPASARVRPLRPLVLALTGLYGLTRPRDATELAAVTAVLPALRAQGVISCDVDWTGAQRRELRGWSAVQHGHWLVRSPDHRSKLSFSVQRQLSVQHDAEVEGQLRGARRSLAVSCRGWPRQAGDC